MEAPAGLGTVGDLKSRYNSCQGRKEMWRSLYQDAFRFASPQRDTFTQYSPGQHKNRHVFDDTAVSGLQTFASRMQAGLTPVNQHWIKFEAGSEIKDDEQRAEVNKLLENEVEDPFFEEIERSNFDVQSTEMYMDLGIGMGGLMIDEGDGVTSPLLNFSAIPLPDFCVEVGAYGEINGFWRKWKMNPRNVESTWPRAEISSQMRQVIDSSSKDTSNKDIEILDGTIFNQKDKRFHQVVIWEKELIFTQAYDELPAVFPRWQVVAGEDYGRGPVIQVLPTIRVVNKMAEFELRAAAIAVTGIWTGVSDQVFNPYTATFQPGSIIPVASNATANPTLRPLELGGAPQFEQLVYEKQKNVINAALFADPLGSLEDPVRTATENILRNQADLRRAGSAFSRQYPEYIYPLVRRIISILKRRGRIPADLPEVDGKLIQIRYVSPIAKAMDVEKAQSFMSYYASLQGIYGPEMAMAMVESSKIPTHLGEAYGIDKDLLKSSDKIQQEMAKAADMAAQAAQKEQMSE